MNTASTPDFQTLPKHNRAAGQQLLAHIRDHSYCALLGPRFTGKSALLLAVQKELAHEPNSATICIDLRSMEAATQTGFLAGLLRATATQIAERTGWQAPLPQGAPLSGADLRAFWEECLRQVRPNLVLMFDHLEALPNDLLRMLLTALRAIRMNPELDHRRFVAVLVGALSLAALTVGETSPLSGIVKRVMVGDLSEEDNRQLIAACENLQGVKVDAPARAALLAAARDDSHLLHEICGRCKSLIAARRHRRLTADLVEEVVGAFVRDSAADYEPLREAVQAVEDDPDLLRSVLQLLEGGAVPRRELPLPLSPDLDPLYLTGLVRKVGEGRYTLRNEIYRRFLAQHLTPGRVGHVLTRAGRWNAAIDYLERSAREEPRRYQADLLAAVINSIQAAEESRRAAYYLARGLAAAFDIAAAAIYYVNSTQTALVQVEQVGHTVEGTLPTPQIIPLQEDRLEVRAYRVGQYVRGPEAAGRATLAVPLVTPGRDQPLGIVVLNDYPIGPDPRTQRERLLQLVGFLNQAARAIASVQARELQESRLRDQGQQIEEKSAQLSLLHRIGTLVQSLTDLEAVLNLVLTGITAGYGLRFNRAWLFLLDSRSTHLCGRMGIGALDSKEAYRSWERAVQVSFDQHLREIERGEIEHTPVDQIVRRLRLPVAPDSEDLFSQVVFRRHAFRWSAAAPGEYALPREFWEQFGCEEVIAVPLLAQGKCLGLIVVDNKFSPRPYTDADAEMLATFANQAAVAIVNAQRREAAETMREVAAVLSGSLDLGTVLDLALEQIDRVLPYDTASIQLLNPERQRLEIIASKGFARPADVKELAFPLSDDYPNVRVLREQQVLRFADIREEFPHFAEPRYQATHARGWLGAPLVVGGKAIGVITLDHSVPGFYTPEHENLAAVLAHQAAIAISNARLFQSEHEARDYLDRLIHSSLDGIIAIDGQGWITIFNEGAQRILGYAPGDVVGRKMHVNELHVDIAKARALEQRLKREGRLENVEVALRAKNGEEIPVLLSSGSLHDSAGNRLGSVGFFRDLRPLRKVENKLRMILETIDTIAHARTMEGGLSALVAGMVEGIGVNIGQVLVFHASRKELRVAAAYANSRHPPSSWEPGLGQKVGLTAAPGMEQLLELAGPTVFARQEATGRILTHLQDILKLPIPPDAALVIPLKAGKKTLGICVLVEIRAGTPSLFTAETIELARSLAEQTAVLIALMEARENAERRIDQLEYLRRVGEDLSRSAATAPREVLARIVEGACKVSGADCAIIYPYQAGLESYDVHNIASYKLNEPDKQFSPKVRSSLRSMTRLVLTSREPLILDDVTTGVSRDGRVRHSGVNKFLQREGVRSFIGLPLWVSDEPVGALFVNYRRPYYLTDEEIEPLTIFANQAAVAIQQARLFQRGEKEHRAILSARSITEAISAESSNMPGTLHPVWPAILEGALHVTGARWGQVLLWDTAEKRLKSALDLGYTEEERAQRFREQGESCAFLLHVLEGTEGRLVADTHEKGETEYCYRHCGHVHSVLAAPIVRKADRQRLGIIVLESTERAAFNADDKRLLEDLAEYADIAIQSATLFEDLQQRTKHLEALYAAAAEIAAHVGLERGDILERILAQAAASITGVAGALPSLCTIHLLDEETEELECKHVHPPERFTALVNALGRRIPLRREQGRCGVISRAVLTQKPQRVRDVRADPDYIAYDPATRSELAVPILDGSKVLGVLNVESDREDGFDPIDEKTLQALAGLAAAALRNVERSEQLSRANSVALLGAWGAEIMHDIRREVGHIRMTIANLKYHPDLPAEVKRQLVEIDDYADKLDFPELPEEPPEPGRPLGPYGAPPLDEMLATEIKRLRGNPIYQDISWRSDLRCGESQVAIHEKWFLRLLHHLTRNAADALRRLPPDRTHRQVTIRSRAHGPLAVIEVQDTGPGVPPEHAPLLFNRSIPHPGKASGKGLLLVRFLAEQHGGKAWLVSSRPDEGTCFAFSIPFAAPEAGGRP